MGNFQRMPRVNRPPSADTNAEEARKMDFYQVPIGFGMALARNPQALNAYSAMTEEQKQAILSQAHNARSEQEMNRTVNGLVR